MKKYIFLAPIFLFFFGIQAVFAFTLKKFEFVSDPENEKLKTVLFYIDPADSYRDGTPKKLELSLAQKTTHAELELQFQGSLEENQQELMRNLFDSVANTSQLVLKSQKYLLKQMQLGLPLKCSLFN